MKKHKYWLTATGERCWYYKSIPTITAHRGSDIIYLCGGSIDRSGRTINNRFIAIKKEFDHPKKYSDFKKEKNLWMPIENFESEYMPIFKMYLEIQKYNL